MNTVATGDTIAAADHNIIVQTLTGVNGQLLTTTAKGANIASAATLTLGTDGNYFQVTGTTGITGISSAPAGTEIILEFQGALLLTHNGTSLILRGATNYTTAAGDVLRFISEGGGNWRETYRGVAGPLTLVYNAAGALSFLPSSDPAAGTEFIQVKNNAGTVQLALSSDGKVYTADGTAPLPGLTWEQDKDTGVYRIAANTIGFATNGVERMRIDTTGVSLDAGTSYLDGTLNANYLINYHAFRYQPIGVGSGVAPGTITNVGSGITVLEPSGHGVIANTGATNPSSTSTAMEYNPVASLADPATVSKIRRIEFGCGVNTLASANSYIFFTTENVNTVPSLTARHFGIKNLNGVLTFSTADGTTEQTTTITTFVTAVQVDYFVITFDGTTARCYINGVLRATHATNVPTAGSGSPVLRIFINNNASTNNVSLHVLEAEALIANS